MDKPCCPDWEPNIDKLNGPIMMQAARSGFMWQYDGPQFRYCPWCGTQRDFALPKQESAKGKE